MRSPNTTRAFPLADVRSCQTKGLEGGTNVGPRVHGRSAHDQWRRNPKGFPIWVGKPGTGKPVEDGEVGEVVVTVLNNYELPIIRFATGDLSAILEGNSTTGRTNKRIKGWMGRADQTTKVRGMFVQPSQVNKILEILNINSSARMIVSRSNDKDELLLKVESDITDTTQIENLQQKISDQIKNVINLRGSTEIVPIKSLPNDGKVIDDIRDFGE